MYLDDAELSSIPPRIAERRPASATSSRASSPGASTPPRRSPRKAGSRVKPSTCCTVGRANPVLRQERAGRGWTQARRTEHTIRVGGEDHRRLVACRPRLARTVTARNFPRPRRTVHRAHQQERRPRTRSIHRVRHDRSRGNRARPSMPGLRHQRDIYRSGRAAPHGC